MHEQTNEEALYHLEEQFKYNDSIRIIRKQVERYEGLVNEQMGRLKRVKRNSEEAEKLHNQKENIKNAK